ncbi:hypothetical protein CBR_g11917 [Chara braunii]|uniref:Uncharacterized protein n=1 Tax=Chara braunii TaxID=69332 RepID=A0A388KQL5_CHABU|nr:hypothetical protein CBR_g11917 [Chara braunii]|eukprot:GBG72339.1 hypothetical protein CBR_g11917 [Chara braunii]
MTYKHGQSVVAQAGAVGVMQTWTLLEEVWGMKSKEGSGVKTNYGVQVRSPPTQAADVKTSYDAQVRYPLMQDTGALPRRSARLAVRTRPAVPPRPKRLNKRKTPAASSTAIKVPVTTGVLPACPVQGAGDPLAAYLQRVQAFTDVVASAKAQEEAAEAERQRLASEAAAQAQQTAEADAVVRDKRNAICMESLTMNETLTAAVRAAATHQKQLLNTTTARINNIEAKASAAPGCTTDEVRQLNGRIYHVVNLIRDIGVFNGPDTISSTVAAIKTDITKLQTRPDVATKTYKMLHFDISKFDDYNKPDALTWWQRFLTEASCRTVPADDMMKALYLQLIGGAQAWMNHLAATNKCTIAELHTHITWKEFEKLWFTQFMVRNVVKAAMNEVYTCSQRNMPTRDWTTKWQKIVTTPGFDLSFTNQRSEFFSRSCAGLRTALGNEYDYASFQAILDRANLVIQTDDKAANERQSQPHYVAKPAYQRPAHNNAVIYEETVDLHAAAASSSDGGIVAALPPKRPKRVRKNKATQETASTGIGQQPWTTYKITKEIYDLRQKYFGAMGYIEDEAGAMAPQIIGTNGTWHATPVGLLLHGNLSLLHVLVGLSQQFPVLPNRSGVASSVYVGCSWKEKINEDTAFPATAVQLEWSHTDRRVQRSVVGELDVGEVGNPIFLIGTDERTKDHLSGLISPLRLPVRLWMSSRTWFHLRAGFVHERSPKCRHEASVAVLDDVFRYVVAANPAGVQETRKFGSRGVVLAREKPRILTQTVNDREDVVVPEAVAGKRSRDVHGNGEAGFPWDRHRAQLAIGIAVAGLASSANFARVAIPSDFGNEVGSSESLPKSCNSAIDSEMGGESRVMVLAEKASPKTTVSWDT